ncbi:hypothetical protein ABVT39_018185 [Epinephelus coioides]
MSKEGKREFEAWYETVHHDTFNFEKEAIRYCQNDVDILALACDIFRKGYIDETDVDPFSCTTIASACVSHKFPTSQHPGHSVSRRLLKTSQNLLKRRRSMTLESVHGHKVNVMREHDWLGLKKSHPPLKDFLKRAKTPRPLSPRDTFYGGKISAMRLRYMVAANETVHYVDVTSLYLYVNCAFPYPLGHPEIVNRDFKEPQNYFGLIRAVVCPPRGKTTEVWHFDSRSDDVFVEYMHTFLKGKQEASGYLAEVSDQESREKYIADYGANQGILLDADKIQPNPAKRQVAKLCLNSLWGKFAQRSNLNQNVLVREPEEFFSYMFLEKHKVKNFSFLNETMALIQWCHGDRYITPPNKTDNVFIAAFTTAYGRLKLYDLYCLHQFQNRVLYLDTDSLIYVAKERETGLKLGNYLGDLTDELGVNTIQEFAAAGPKSYAYLTRKNKRAVLRVKGITQTHECCEKNQF